VVEFGIEFERGVVAPLLCCEDIVLLRSDMAKLGLENMGPTETEETTEDIVLVARTLNKQR
jgi:hypothetical protein